MKTERASRLRFACAVCGLCLVLSLVAVAGQNASTPYRTALPGYRYSFPHDYFNHPDFQTEWWYYTGNLQSADGHRFGFELTFFRQGIDRDRTKAATWDVRDLYLAHLALSDLDGDRFCHTERVNRAGPGLAGADEATQRIWNGNWRIQWKDSDQVLQAIGENFELHFTLHPEKPPVIHGENGVSQKGEGAGRASHYISLTRVATKGAIVLNTKSFNVTGLSWMDHEFFTEQLASNQTGWDWLSIQLDDNTELMLFNLRRADGSVDPFSSGTYIDAQGQSSHLRKEDFMLQPLTDAWKSPASGAIYPIRWRITIPKLGIDLTVTTPLASQEISGVSGFTPTYWEGAIAISGVRSSHSVAGLGYLEMTGYDRPVRLTP